MPRPSEIRNGQSENWPFWALEIPRACKAGEKNYLFRKVGHQKLYVADKPIRSASASKPSGPLLSI